MYTSENRLIQGNLNARQVDILKSALGQFINGCSDCNGNDLVLVGVNGDQYDLNDLNGLYDELTHAMDEPEVPYEGITEEAKFAIGEVISDYMSVLMPDEAGNGEEYCENFKKGVSNICRMLEVDPKDYDTEGWFE
jgi:hypothetical protein